MASLYHTCPTTKLRAPIGMEADARSLQIKWFESLRIACPHCGEMHETTVREAYANGALDDYMATTSRSGTIQN
jgi:hypothetical protein